MKPRDVSSYLRIQAQYCDTLGSPFYGTLFRHAADDFDRGGPIAQVFADYPHDPVLSAMALRLTGCLHYRVLELRAPSLARHYPSAGGDGDAEAAWVAFRDLVANHVDELRHEIRDHGVQTNEVGRSAALLCGFLTVARETGWPLRCLEVGASAGLNLRWDRFRYEAASRTWGDPQSPVALRDVYASAEVPFDVHATVAERAGCDPNPVDATTPHGVLRLLSYVWPDQAQRFALLRAACEVARRVPATVDRANGADWAAKQLATPRPGVATIVYHSIVLQYFDRESRERLIATITDAGTRATPDAPVAWLRMEPGGEQAEVRLTLWPGGVERLVATTSFHGRDVRYALAPAAAVP